MTLRFLALIAILIPSCLFGQKSKSTPPQTLNGWHLQDSATVPDAAAIVSSDRFHPTGWYAATVPGTVLSTLVNNGVYPEPLYGENNRPDKIPDSLSRAPYWYRTVFKVPKSYAGKRVWLNLGGIKYSS